MDAEWKPTKRMVRGYGIVASEELEESIGADIPNEESYHYYHLNEHGDVEYITERDGKVKNAYTYDAYGNITNPEELIKNRYTYNGEQYDQISQQYYLRARSYNSMLGRFTQEDVYHGDGLNLYAYCGNNSVMYVDPSGYKGKKCFSQANRPRGYKTGDVDSHGFLSPGDNRAKGYTNTKPDKQIQSHHPVQNEWAKRWAKKNNKKYNEDMAAAILLPSNSGESHAKISAAQRARRKQEGFNTTITHEFNVGYREMIDAGVDMKSAKKAMRRAYKYFDSIDAVD